MKHQHFRKIQSNASHNVDGITERKAHFTLSSDFYWTEWTNGYKLTFTGMFVCLTETFQISSQSLQADMLLTAAEKENVATEWVWNQCNFCVTNVL